MNTYRQTTVLPRTHRIVHQPVFNAPSAIKVSGQGNIQPPRNSVVAIAETVTMFTYSARKNSANFSDEYSVWKPPTSSDSASGRSNGARLVSPTIEITKITKLGSSSTAYQPLACAATISLVDNEPV